MSNTIPTLLPGSRTTSASKEKAPVTGSAASSGKVSSEGKTPNPDRPATDNPSTAAPATIVSLSPGAAKGIAAYSAQEPSVTERWSESTREAIAEKIAEAAAANDRTGIRVSTDVHEATGRYIIRVIESETGEVLKEFPPADYLDVVAALEELEGVLLSEEL